MPDFYGYDASKFIPDKSWISALGQSIASYVVKIPEVAEMDKAIQEGRVQKQDIYDAIKSKVDSIDDNEFETYFGMDKKSFSSILKPGRKETADDYKVRATTAMKPYVGIAAKQNVTSAQNEIGVMNQPFKDYQGDVKETMQNPDFASAMNAIGGPAKGPSPATPEDVQRIGTKYNVPSAQLQPEMTEAINNKTTQQLGKIDPTKTQIGAYQAIGGGVTAETMSAIGSLPNQPQEANAIIGASQARTAEQNAGTNRIKADADLERAKSQQGKTDVTEKNNELKNLIDLKEITSKSINDKQARFNFLRDKVNQFMVGDDENEKESYLKEMKKISRDIQSKKKDEQDLNSQINQLQNLNLSTSSDSDEALDAIDRFNSKKNVDDPIEITAERLYSMARNDYKLQMNYKKILNALNSGSSTDNIIRAIVKQAGM